jgi:ApbE superfamily uncharacterized protein (UPF0280 family)
MGDVVNLRRARKARQRADREATAAANRVAFGRDKIERRETALKNAQAERSLDGHRRDTPDGDA